MSERGRCLTSYTADLLLFYMGKCPRSLWTAKVLGWRSVGYGRTPEVCLVLLLWFLPLTSTRRRIPVSMTDWPTLCSMRESDTSPVNGALLPASNFFANQGRLTLPTWARFPGMDLSTNRFASSPIVPTDCANTVAMTLGSATCHLLRRVHLQHTLVVNNSRDSSSYLCRLHAEL